MGLCCEDNPNCNPSFPLAWDLSENHFNGYTIDESNSYTWFGNTGCMLPDEYYFDGAELTDNWLTGSLGSLTISNIIDNCLSGTSSSGMDFRYLWSVEQEYSPVFVADCNYSTVPLDELEEMLGEETCHDGSFGLSNFICEDMGLVIDTMYPTGAWGFVSSETWADFLDTDSYTEGFDHIKNLTNDLICYQINDDDTKPGFGDNCRQHFNSVQYRS